MTTILISIKPEWFDKIFCTKEKKIEARVKFNVEAPFRAYVYCTQDKPDYFASGTVAGVFECNKVDTYGWGNLDYPAPCYDGDPSVVEVGEGYFVTGADLQNMCLSYEQFEAYGKKRPVKGIYIEEPRLLDKPLSVLAFERPVEKAIQGMPRYGWSEENLQVRRAPQSWCYVEEPNV